MEILMYGYKDTFTKVFWVGPTKWTLKEFSGLLEDWKNRGDQFSRFKKKIQIKVCGCNITGLRKIMKLLTHNMFLRRTEIPSDSMRNVSKASNSDLWHRNVWVVWIGSKLVPMEMMTCITKILMIGPVLKSRKFYDHYNILSYQYRLKFLTF